jgi:hypothetical protein
MKEISLKEVAPLAKEEAIKLKPLLTSKQTHSLHFKTSFIAGIYDLLCEDSESNEAIRLLNKVAKPFSADLARHSYPDHSNFDRKFTKNLFSPLEIFWHLAVKENKFVISFLKDDINEKQFIKLMDNITKS